jgi:hypothetical protein
MMAAPSAHLTNIGGRTFHETPPLPGDDGATFANCRNEVPMAEKFTAAYWHERAEEARVLAERITTEDLRLAMLEVVSNYEALAEYTEKMERRRRQPPSRMLN